MASGAEIFADQLDSIEIKGKLEAILQVLQQEQEQMREIYQLKISELYEEIEEKNDCIEELRTKVEQQETQFLKMEGKLSEKDSIISTLQRKIKDLQSKIGSQIQGRHDFLQHIADSLETPKDCNAYSPSKRINISEYFVSCLKGKQSTPKSTVSDDLQKQMMSLLKVDSRKTCECSEIDPESPNRSRIHKARSLESNLFHIEPSSSYSFGQLNIEATSIEGKILEGTSICCKSVISEGNDSFQSVAPQLPPARKPMLGERASMKRKSKYGLFFTPSRL